MALGWGTRRKLIYGTVGTLLALVVLWLGYQTLVAKAPTCFDGAQNRDESGVDCGGTYCSLVCAAEARAPVVKWARAFETAPGIYTAAAYVQNNNVGAGTKNIRYSFQLFDDKNLLVVEKQGVANIPPVQITPLVEANISVGNRTVARAFFTFLDVPTWSKVSADAFVPLSVTNQRLAQDGTRLSATLVNESVKDVRGVTVVAVLFDAEGVARAASKSTLGVVSGKGSQEVVFTWPSAVPNLLRAEITVVPSF